MNDMKIPIVETGNGGFKVSIDLNLYNANAITATIYKYTDKFYIYQRIAEDEGKVVNIIFESKGETVSPDVVKQFCNDLIDQQLREITTEKYGHIRDLIVKEAFNPVMK